MEKTLGVAPAAITCFLPDGGVDVPSTVDHVRWLLDAGVHAIIATGTCGEFASLDEAERQQLIDAYVSAIDGRVPLFVGVMHSSTRVAVSLARYAERAGASGVMSVSPYYGALPERELLGYFRDVAAAISIPLMVYDNPRSAGVALTNNGLEALAREGTARYIKDSSGDPSRLAELRPRVPDSVGLIYGNDHGCLEALAAGADGWVTGIGNFMPRHAVALWNRIADADLLQAREIWQGMQPLANACYRRAAYASADGRPDFVPMFKAALEYLSFTVGGTRRPLLPPLDSEAQALRELMDSFDLTAATA